MQPFFTLSLAPRQHLLSLFFLIFHFSGLEQDDSKYIDISDSGARHDLLSAFKKSGFANQSLGYYKLLPCSLGWFVNSSSEDNNCKECPAGKLPLNLADNHGDNINLPLIYTICSHCLTWTLYPGYQRYRDRARKVSGTQGIEYQMKCFYFLIILNRILNAQKIFPMSTIF